MIYEIFCYYSSLNNAYLWKGTEHDSESRNIEREGLGRDGFNEGRLKFVVG